MTRRKGRKRKGWDDPAQDAPLPPSGALIGYARVSTDDQSLSQQVAELEKAGCLRVFREHVSATARKRPQLDEAFETLRAGDVLVVYALDRFARSLPDLIKLLERIDEMKAGFKVISQPAIDTTSPLGRLLLAVLGAVAEFELSLIRKRTRDGMQRLKAEGRTFGRERILTDAQIIAAQKLRGKKSVREIAAQFDVSPGTISNYTSSPEALELVRVRLGK